MMVDNVSIAVRIDTKRTHARGGSINLACGGVLLDSGVPDRAVERIERGKRRKAVEEGRRGL